VPLEYLVDLERSASKPTGMESFSESACFHRLRDLLWCVAGPRMAPFLTAEQSAALAEFECAYRSLPWSVIEAHPHISELPNDDLSPLVPAGQRLLQLIDSPTAPFEIRWFRQLFSSLSNHATNVD
jgi:hypothetical protein